MLNVSAASLLTQLPTNMPRTAEDGPGMWVPGIRVGAQHEVLGPWLQPGQALAVVDTWGTR